MILKSLFITLLITLCYFGVLAQGKYISHIANLETKLNLWRLDSLGCNGSRDTLAYQFWNSIDHYIEGDTILTKILLGNPNEIFYGANISYYYYFQAKCDNQGLDSVLAPELFVIMYNNKGKFKATGYINH